MAGGITSLQAAVGWADLKSRSVVVKTDKRTNSITGVSVEPILASSTLYGKQKHKGDCSCKACTMGMGGGKARLKADGPESGGEAPHYTVQGRNFSTKKRNKLAKSGAAMKDGSYPIQNAKDLENAKKDYYRTGKSSAVKSHIKKRAKALGISDPFASKGVTAGGPGSGRKPGFGSDASAMHNTLIQNGYKQQGHGKLSDDELDPSIVRDYSDSKGHTISVSDSDDDNATWIHNKSGKSGHDSGSLSKHLSTLK